MDAPGASALREGTLLLDGDSLSPTVLRSFESDRFGHRNFLSEGSGENGGYTKWRGANGAGRHGVQNDVEHDGAPLHEVSRAEQARAEARRASEQPVSRERRSFEVDYRSNLSCFSRIWCTCWGLRDPLDFTAMRQVLSSYETRADSMHDRKIVGSDSLGHWGQP